MPPAPRATEPSITVTLRPLTPSWDPRERRWHAPVEIEFSNATTGAFELDKLTACAGGRIANAVFEVEGPAGPIPYRGMMAKRAHPGRGGFLAVRPGAPHTVTVDLGEVYALPRRGTVSVRFDHFNHFSIHAVQLRSAPVDLVLA